MQKVLVFSLGKCPEAIMFIFVLSENFRDIVLPATPNLQPLQMFSSLLLGEDKSKYRYKSMVYLLHRLYRNCGCSIHHRLMSSGKKKNQIEVHRTGPSKVG